MTHSDIILEAPQALTPEQKGKLYAQLNAKEQDDYNLSLIHI